jgi:hypothetical protein
MAVPFPKAEVLLLDKSDLSNPKCAPFFGCFLFHIRFISEDTVRLILQQVCENAKDTARK